MPTVTNKTTSYQVEEFKSWRDRDIRKDMEAWLNDQDDEWVLVAVISQHDSIFVVMSNTEYHDEYYNGEEAVYNRR